MTKCFFFLALSYLLHREVIWSLCKENNLLSSTYIKSKDKYGHQKMAK